MNAWNQFESLRASVTIGGALWDQKELPGLFNNSRIDLKLRSEQHLSVCAECVVYLDQMRSTIQTLGAKPRIEIPTAIESNLLRAFRRWKNSQ